MCSRLRYDTEVDRTVRTVTQSADSTPDSQQTTAVDDVPRDCRENVQGGAGAELRHGSWTGQRYVCWEADRPCTGIEVSISTVARLCTLALLQMLLLAGDGDRRSTALHGRAIHRSCAHAPVHWTYSSDRPSLQLGGRHTETDDSTSPRTDQ